MCAVLTQRDKELNEACLHASATGCYGVLMGAPGPGRTSAGQCMYANITVDAQFVSVVIV